MPHDRSRSRSPYRQDHTLNHGRRRRRSRTPDRAPDRASKLPLGARHLDKTDYKQLQSLFALYLDVQKQLILEDLPEREARGRWKSFVNKWNRGDLAEGWYDPDTYRKAELSFHAASSHDKASSPAAGLPQSRESRKSPVSSQNATNITHSNDHETRGDENEDEDYGPSLPTSLTITHNPHKPTIPTMTDLTERDELSEHDHASTLNSSRQIRTAHRKLEAERLNELAPRAEPGTRDRQLEKRREAAGANRAFAAAKTEAGGTVEVRDDELMGGGGDDEEELRRMKRDNEKRKSEREVRREEVLRAKQEEREMVVRRYRQKEEETMKGLVELARRRFG